jgi:hypothetical protein
MGDAMTEIPEEAGRKDGRQKRHEFRVVIEGLDLSEDDVQRINRAVQSAVAIQMAEFDFHGDQKAIFPWGRTWGIWWGPIGEGDPHF